MIWTQVSKQLLHLLAHSLYQSREIAVRELVSNASDALDKMRHLALVDEKHRDDVALEIVVDRDEKNRTLAICDNGIGMTRDELVENLEIFRRRELDVLYLIDPIDEFVMSALGKYEDRELVSIDAADLELPPEAEEEQEKDKEGDEKSEKETEGEPAGFDRVLDVFRSALEGKVEDVRRSKRLTDSPCCLVNSEGGMSSHMQNLMKLVHEDFSVSKPIMEVNPASPLVATLCGLGPEEDDFIKLCGRQLFDNALLLEGVTPPAQEMAARVQRFVEQAAEKRGVNES
jgi:molecular chaperone HtpG